MIKWLLKILNMPDSVKKFIKDFFGGSDETSYKRGTGFLAFNMLVVILILNAFGIVISEFLIGMFASLTGIMGVLTVIEKFKK